MLHKTSQHDSIYHATICKSLYRTQQLCLSTHLFTHHIESRCTKYRGKIHVLSPNVALASWNNAC